MAATKAKMQQAAEEKKSTKAVGVKVTVLQNYYDMQLKCIKHAGDVLSVDSTRAAELQKLGLVE